MTNLNKVPDNLFLRLQANYQALKERVDIIEPRESIGGAPQFAEIYFDQAGVSFNVVTNNPGVANKVIIPYDTNGESNGALPDHGNERIIITVAGRYYIFCNFSARSANANNYEAAVYLNNGGVDIQIHAHRTTSTAGRLGAFSASGFENLAVGDTVETWLIRLDGPAAARTITFEHANFGLFKVGN